MKKLGLLVMPLMAVSLLASCGGGDKPSPKEYTLSIKLNNCKIGEESSSYSKKYTEGATIDSISVAPIDDYALTKDSISGEYKNYWKESATPGTWTFSGLTMDSDHELTISATELVTLSINLDNCKIGEESTTYTKTYLKGKIIDSVAVTPSGGHILAKNSVPSEYKDYWEESTTPGTWTFSGLTMDSDHELTISAAEEVTLTINLSNCKVSGSTTYTKAYAKGSTIEPVIVTPDDDLTLTTDSVSKEYQQYWSSDDGWKLSGLVMDQSHTITINAGYIFSIAASDITISPNLIIPNQKYEGKILINKEAINSKILPLSLNSVILDDDTNTDITDKCIYEVNDNNMDSIFEIPADYTTNGIAVSLTTKSIDSAKWYDYVNWWGYCSCNTASMKAIPDDIKKEVNLTVNNQVHKVRLIDVDKDSDAKGNKIHCTFEFVNLLSDNSGYSLATYWNDGGNNKNYMDSTIRAVLNGEGKAEIKWFQYFGMDEDETDEAKGTTSKNKKYSQDFSGKTVLSMLPSGLVSALKEPSKNINVWDSELSPAGYDEKVVNDKLFLLSPAEMGITTPHHQEPSDSCYTYYSGDDKGKRIKHQLKWHDGARTSDVSGIEGKGGGTKKSCAGYNDQSDAKGGAYWLKSPYTANENSGFYVSSEGNFNNGRYVYQNAFGISPAFCI